MNELFAEARPTRPIWLVTLADLALLLLGFIVLVLSHQGNQRALAAGLRDRFGGHAQAGAPAAVATEPGVLPLAAASMLDFAPASAALPDDPAALIGWAKRQAGDPRVRLTITGLTDGSAADLDPLSRSAPLLAADRARMIAARLVAAGIAGRQIAITTAVSPGKRGAMVTAGFAGDRQ